MLENKQFKIEYIEYAILLNSTLLLFPNKFKVYPIILLLLLSIIYKYKSLVVKPFPYKKIFLISLILFLYLLSYLYALKPEKAFLKISTMASIIGFPVIFGILQSSGFNITYSLKNKIFIAFCNAVIIFIILSFLLFWKQEFTFSETIVHYSNLINTRLKAYSIHPIYLSIYISVGILMLIFLIKENQSKKIKIISILMIIFFAVILAILMRRGPILSLIISSAILLISFFRIKRAFLGLFLIIAVVCVTIKYLPKYNNENRFESLIHKKYLLDSNSSVGIRYNIYMCCLEKISQKPILGYGVGSVQRVLDSCYEEKGIDTKDKNYNSHNQYFSIILHAGFLGLILYLCSIFKLFHYLFKQKSFIGISILLFFLLSFLTENVVEREHGMLLYSYLLCIFVFNEKKLRP